MNKTGWLFVIAIYYQQFTDVVKASTYRMKYEPTQKIPNNKKQDAQKINELKQWLLDNHAEINSGIYTYYSDNDYRGIASSLDINKNQDLLIIPAKTIISVELARESPTGKQMDRKGLFKKLLSPRQSFIAAFMLAEEEKGSQSQWKSVIDSFPPHANDMATFFTEKELKMLQGSALPKILYFKKEELKWDFGLIIGAVPDFESRFSFEKFHYWRSTIMNRTFGGTMNGQDTTFICPFSHLLNHRNPYDVTYTYNDNSKNFRVTAVTDIPANKEIFTTYGNKCNTRWLLNYGIIVDNNFEYNEVHFFFEPKNFEYLNQEIFKEKQEWIEYHDQATFDYNFKLSIRFKEYNVKQAIGYLRFITIDNLKDYKTFVRREAEKGKWDGFVHVKPTSLKGEVRMLKSLLEFCEKRLAGYPTTMEADLDLLEGDKIYKDFTVNESNIIKYRMAEKEMVRAQVEFATTVLEIYTENDNLEIMTQISEILFKDPRYEGYFDDNVLDLFDDSAISPETDL